MKIDEILGQTVKDEYLQSFTVTEKLSEGGQGVVFYTDKEDYVIKFAFDAKKDIITKDENSELYEYYKNEYTTLYLNPFPQNIHIAYPLAVLRDYAGYVMKLASGMTSFKSLMNIQDYSKTGGIKRRLDLLSKTAGIIAELHSVGLVYSDVSSGNVFVTKYVDGKNQNVWLIDSDNIFLANSLDGSKGKCVFTPRFAAPELINETSKSTQESDVYAFACMAFNCLSQNHPFHGDLIDEKQSEEEVVGWSQEKTAVKKVQNTEELYSGKVPWIEDKDDQRNHTKNGFPGSYYMTEELFTLFNKTFTHGRNKPQQRPPIYFWPKAFAHARNTSICCSYSDCKMTYIYEKNQTSCPFCGKKNRDIFLIKNKEKIVFAHEILWDEGVSESEKIFIPESVFLSFNMQTQTLPILSIVFIKKGKSKSLSLKKTDSLAASQTRFFVEKSKSEKEEIINDVLKYQSYDNVCKICVEDEEFCFQLIKSEE